MLRHDGITVATSCYTYILRHNFDVLAILNQTEDWAWPRAVRVRVPSVFVFKHDPGLAERAEVQRVNDPALIDLAANQFTQCGPNLGDLPQLVPLLVCGKIAPSLQQIDRGIVFNVFATRARQYLSVQFLAEVSESTLAHKRLQDVLLVQPFSRHFGVSSTEYVMLEQVFI